MKILWSMNSSYPRTWSSIYYMHLSLALKNKAFLESRTAHQHFVEMKRQEGERNVSLFLMWHKYVVCRDFVTILNKGASIRPSRCIS